MELGTITALVMILLGLGHVFDNILKEPQVRTVREKINHWFDQLGRVQDESVLKKTAAYFVELFDAIYGEKHLSWKCFWRSCVFSTLGLVITFLVCLYLDFFLPSLIWSALWFVCLVYPHNLFIDYFSLVQTRLFLNFVSRLHVACLPLLLVFDICLSFLIYYGVISLYGISSTEVKLQDINLILSPIIKHVTIGLFEPNLMTPFIYSTFFTSVTFYAFVIITILLRILLLAKLPTRAILGWLRTSENPVKAVVGVLGGVVIVFAAIEKLVK